MKTGRNDPCPCGSGLKYKKCCLSDEIKRIIKINIHTDLCPCESGKIVKDCTCFNGGSALIPLSCIKENSDLEPIYKNDKCYAKGLNNCSTKITKEHFISHGVLKLFNAAKGLSAKGFSWQKTDQLEIISPNALASNILCKSHNEVLSPLDTLATRFFDKTINLNQLFNDQLNEQKIYLFNGHDIERWMLKVLCGSVFSGNALYQSKRIVNWEPPKSWLDILFRGAEFPLGWGLYFSSAVGSFVESKPDFNFAMITDGKYVGGLIAQIHGFQFILVMSDLLKNKNHPLLVNSNYRPKEIIFVDSKRNNMVGFMLGWKIKGEDQTVKIRYMGRSDPRKK